jgi:clan AA aspartic protease (TIGR02281 family)
MKKKIRKQNKILLVASLINLICAYEPTAMADPYFDQGYKLYSQKKYHAAAPYFEQSVNNSPWDSTSLYYAALTYHQLRNLTKAKALYINLLDRFPDTPAALNATAALSVLDPNYIRKRSFAPAGKSSSGLNSTSGINSIAAPRHGQDNLPQQSRVYFTSKGQSFLIDAQINNRNIKMIFDTGASTTLLGKNHLQQLGISPPSGNPNGQGAGVGSASSLPIWNMNVDIKVGDILRRGYPIVVQENLPTDPLLGQTFFNDFTYTIDNGAHNILFQKKESGYRASTAYQVPFKKEGTHLIVSVEINGKPCEMIFDTGADRCSFTKQQAKAIGIAIPEDAEEGTSTGISGTTKTSVFQVKRMKLGPIDKSNVSIGVVDESAMRHPLLGQNFFNDFQYTIDNASSVINFVKR